MPYSFINAGRHVQGQRPIKGQPQRPSVQLAGRRPRSPSAASCTVSEMTTKQLVAAREVAELARRGRDIDGVKLAWKAGAKKPKQIAANNPWAGGNDVKYARFPSKCAKCGKEFVTQRQAAVQSGLASKIVDSGIRGPRGGKKMVHVGCV